MIGVCALYMLIVANSLLMGRASSSVCGNPRSNTTRLSPRNPNTPYPAPLVCPRSTSFRVAGPGTSAVRLHMGWSIRMQARYLIVSQYVFHMPL